MIPAMRGARFLGQHVGEGAHQCGPGVPVPVWDRDPPHFGVCPCFDPVGKGVCGAFGLVCAVGQALAGAGIFGKDHNIGERRPLFLLERRAGQGQQYHKSRDTPHGPPAQTAEHGQQSPCEHNTAKDGQHQPRHQRVKNNGVVHCPNLSSSAGTWT